MFVTRRAQSCHATPESRTIIGKPHLSNNPAGAHPGDNPYGGAGGYAGVAPPERMKAKVCLVGEAAVGKTSLVRRFVVDEFDDRYVTTLGAKVSKKEMEFDVGERRVHMDMTVWDIMGEKAFRDLLKDAYFSGARGVLAVCDVTRYSTLKELDEWVTSVFRVAGQMPVVYAVNKIDLKDEVLLLYGEREIALHAGAFDAPWFHTSAKTGENVEAVFRTLGERLAAATA